MSGKYIQGSVVGVLIVVLCLIASPAFAITEQWTIKIPGTWAYDVDTNTLTTPTDAHADFWWNQNVSESQLVPLNGASVAIVGQLKLDSLTTCSLYEFSKRPIDNSPYHNLISRETVLCIHTNENRYAKARIDYDGYDLYLTIVYQTDNSSNFGQTSWPLKTGLDWGQGSVEPTCNENCWYLTGHQVTVVATPAPGWSFSRWSTMDGVTCEFLNSSCTFSMPPNRVVLGASFAPIPTQFMKLASAQSSIAGVAVQVNHSVLAGLVLIAAVAGVSFLISRVRASRIAINRQERQHRSKRRLGPVRWCNAHR